MVDNKYGLRCHNVDGPYWLPLRNKETIDNVLKKYPELEYDYFYNLFHNVGIPNFKHISELVKMETMIIVGKGPSTDIITPDTFNEEVPVLACNCAITYLEELINNPLYFTQMDCNTTYKVKFATPIIPKECVKDYKKSPVGFYFDPTELFGERFYLTGIAAIAIAKYLGAKKLMLFGMDAMFGNSKKQSKCSSCEPPSKIELYEGSKEKALELLQDIEYMIVTTDTSQKDIDMFLNQARLQNIPVEFSSSDTIAEG